MQGGRAGWSPRNSLWPSLGVASSLELGAGFDPAGTRRLNAKHAPNAAMQPRLRHAPSPQRGTGIQARGPALRQPEGERGSGLCLGQAMGQSGGLPTSAWPMAIASKWPCINSRSPHCTDPPATPYSPIQTPMALLSPISPSWRCPMAADPLPPFPHGPTVPQASKLSAGLTLQAGRGGRGGDEGHAGLQPPKGGRQQYGAPMGRKVQSPFGAPLTPHLLQAPWTSASSRSRRLRVPSPGFGVVSLGR